MRSVFKLRSIKAKILMLFIVGTTIVLVLQVGVFQRWISTIIVEKSETYFHETVYQIGRRVDLQIRQFEGTALGISGNQVIKNYLSDLNRNELNYQIAKYKIIRELLRQTNLDVIDNIYIYPLSRDPINLYYTEPHPESEAFTAVLLKRADAGSDNEIIWRVFERDPYQIALYVPIADEGEKLGLLRINVNESFFSSILEGVSLGKTGHIYLAAGGSIVFSIDRGVLRVAELPESTGTHVEFPMHNEGWKLIGNVPREELVDQFTQFNRIFILMVVLILVAVLFFALATARLLLRPLKRVMKGMESIQRGNLNVNLDLGRNDEFSMINRNFNYMVERIRSLIETVYRQQVSYRKAEMQGLQAKLNPHFLYNTLDMIYWMLIVREQEEIGDLIVALSGILRYSISHQNEFVTVAEDMAQLDNYLKIQKFRFDERLEYDLRIPEEAADIKIPKLLIQPLAENAIKYAFGDMKQAGRLQINGFVDGCDLIFEVIDNGVGMPEEAMRKHRLQEADDHEDGRTGIGIPLVHARAKYVYGEGCGVTVESAEGSGTKVTVKLRTATELNHEEMWSDDKGESRYA